MGWFNDYSEDYDRGRYSDRGLRGARGGNRGPSDGRYWNRGYGGGAGGGAWGGGRYGPARGDRGYPDTAFARNRYGYEHEYRRDPQQSPTYGRGGDQAAQRWARRYGYDVGYEIQPRNTGGGMQGGWRGQGRQGGGGGRGIFDRQRGQRRSYADYGSDYGW